MRWLNQQSRNGRVLSCSQRRKTVYYDFPSTTKQVTKLTCGTRIFFQKWMNVSIQWAKLVFSLHWTSMISTGQSKIMKTTDRRPRLRLIMECIYFYECLSIYDTCRLHFKELWMSLLLRRSGNRRWYLLMIFWSSPKQRIMKCNMFEKYSPYYEMQREPWSWRTARFYWRGLTILVT